MSHGHNPTPNVVYTGAITNNTLFEGRFSGFWLQASDDANDPSAPMTRGHRSALWNLSETP